MSQSTHKRPADAAGAESTTQAQPSPPPRKKTRARAQSNAIEGPASSLTPAMRQYLEQKASVGDAILLFRMGDFYETFYEDAKTIARVLNLTLTARDKNSAQPIPLAGVPYHAVDRYVARLVKAGFQVAISEQVEDPKLAKGVVRREIARIITPGTLTDDALLAGQEESVLAAVCPTGAALGNGLVGLSVVELSSGRFFAQMVPAARLIDELARLHPAELIVPESNIDQEDSEVARIRESLSVCVTTRPRHVFDEHLANLSLCNHFGVAGLAGFGFDRFDASLSAAAAILDYLKTTQRASLSHILNVLPRSPNESVLIDQVTLRSLEVERTLRDGNREGSLLGAMDAAVNPMGARRLREWLCFPLRDVTAIERRQQAVADLLARPDKLGTARELLREMGDIERIIARLGVGRASPRDIAALGRALLLANDLREVIQREQSGKQTDLLGEIAESLAGLVELGDYLTKSLKEDAPPVLRDGGFINDGHNAELDRLRSLERDGARLLSEMQAREAQRTGIPNLKIDYNSVFGYYIEITHSYRDRVPPEYVRKQTVRNAERYITDELKRHENDILGAADRARQMELELFQALCVRAAQDLPRLRAAADALARLDVIGGFADVARRRECCRPRFDEGAECLQIVDGRHPVLDALLAERFVPNDCAMSSDGKRLLVITGPNMAGKSTYIRQTALLVLLAQTGAYVPAKSMRLSPVDRIFARVGSSDELSRGQSTFMVEMVETARILNNATADSLVVLDEIGRGTSTYDGLAIAWAITEHLATKTRCRTLFATHYHELTDLADSLEGVANYNVAVREELRPSGAGRGVVFLHKIIPGPTDKSYGVHVAAMAGLPASVVRRSETVLEHLETRPVQGKGRRDNAKSGASDQLMLFQGSPEVPEWCREIQEMLQRVNVDQTTPMDALTILKQLRDLTPPTT